MRSPESEERQVHKIPKENIDRCVGAYYVKFWTSRGIKIIIIHSIMLRFHRV